MTPLRALLALACCLALAACGEEATTPGAPVPAPSSSSSANPDPGGISAPVGPNAAAVREPCVGEADAVLAGQSADAEIRPDPVRARVCSHPLADTQPPGADPALPSYTLLEAGEAQKLARLYTGLKPAPADQICTADIGPTASVLFEYPDGSAVAVATELYGCASSRLTPGQNPPLAGPPELRPALEEITRDAGPYDLPVGEQSPS